MQFGCIRLSKRGAEREYRIGKLIVGGNKGAAVPVGLSVYLASRAPAVAFSWELFPATLKATPLAVLLFTSSVAAETW